MAEHRDDSKNDGDPQPTAPPRLVSASMPNQSLLSSPDRPPFAISFIAASNNDSNVADDSTTERDGFSDDAEDFLHPDEQVPLPQPRTELPYFGVERQETRLVVSGIPNLRPSLILTTPDTRNNEDEVRAARCKTWVTDEHKRPREGLTLRPVILRRGKSSKGSARAWFDDETLAHIKQTPRPMTPRWAGIDREEMEGLDLGEAVEDVEMDEEEIEVLREAIPPRRGRNSRRATGQQAELRHFRRKMVDGKEVTHGSSPVYQALAVMEHVEMEYETAEKGTQYESDWE